VREPRKPSRSALRSSLRRPSLVRRLVALAAAWSVLILAIAGLSLTAFFRNTELHRFDDDISGTIDGLVAGASVEEQHIIPPSSMDTRTQRAYSGEYWQISTIGSDGALHAVIRSRSLWDHVLTAPPPMVAKLKASPGAVIFYDMPGPVRQPLRIAALLGRLPDFPAPVVFMSAQDRSEVDRDVRRFSAEIILALLLFAVGLIAAVIVQVRVGLRPLFALRREVAAVRTGSSERIEGRYPSELEPLAVELNALMAHNHAVVERQRTHVGNLAHALKTPLSVILTEARNEPGPLADLVERQAAAMGQHLEHHLRRARAAARNVSHGERTPVAPLLEELSRTLEKIFRDKVSAVDWRADDELVFLGERQDLLEIAGNVMENACKWCTANVRATAEARGERQILLTVEDDGPGLADHERGEVLRRGARLDESAPGSGLGLSIVDELVRVYQGALTLEASDMGGLKVAILLPRADG